MNSYSKRNPNINTYVKMINFLINRNIKVIKVGFPGSKHQNIKGLIDYANDFRTPFGDIFLHANAYFVVSGASGNHQLASSFNTPNVITNAYDIQTRPLQKDDLYIPCKYFKKDEKKYLTILEMLDGGTKISHSEYLINNNIELKLNTENEILDLTKEMISILDNKISYSKDEIILQERFDSCFKLNHVGYKVPGRIGTAWIKDNQDLL